MLAVVEVDGIHKQLIVRRRFPNAGYWNDQYGGLTDSQVIWWRPLSEMPEEDTDAE